MLGAVKPTCGSGELLGPWKDGDGTDRYACLHEPAPVKPGRRVALLVYLHPSLFGTWTITHTNLLDLQRTSSLGGGPAGPGFIVLAPQGRNTTHYYQWPDNRGMGWDNWYRQLSPAGDVKIGNDRLSGKRRRSDDRSLYRGGGAQRQKSTPGASM